VGHVYGYNLIASINLGYLSVEKGGKEMSWEVLGLIIGAASLLVGAVGVTFQILSWNTDRKLLKRENPPSQLGKTDRHVG
jgi:hypothetical protein